MATTVVPQRSLQIDVRLAELATFTATQPMFKAEIIYKCSFSYVINEN